MIIAPRRLTQLGLSAVFAATCLAAPALHAQESSAGPTPLDRALTHFDLGLSGAGEFTGNTSGTGQNGQPVSLVPSRTIGFLVAIRYTHSPYIGLEFNFNQTRYSQNFTFANLTPTLNGTGAPTVTNTTLDVQNAAIEYSFGYVAKTRRTYAGVQPFASVGAGTIDFRPTRGGGAGSLPQARAAYYYSIGAETFVYGNFGVRLAFRQVFANAPDFQETYLRDHQHTSTYEPTFGFYYRF